VWGTINEFIGDADPFSQSFFGSPPRAMWDHGEPPGLPWPPLQSMQHSMADISPVTNAHKVLSTSSRWANRPQNTVENGGRHLGSESSAPSTLTGPWVGSAANVCRPEFDSATGRSTVFITMKRTPCHIAEPSRISERILLDGGGRACFRAADSYEQKKKRKIQERAPLCDELPFAQSGRPRNGPPRPRGL